MKVTADRSLFCHFKKTVSRLAFLSLVFIAAFTNFSCGSFFGGDEPEDSGSEQTETEDDWEPIGVPELMPIPFIPDGSEPSDFSGAESQAAQPEPEKPRIIPTTKFCGFLFNEGAMPAQVEEILAAVEEELKAEQEGADPETLAAIRAAFPSLPNAGPGTDYFYFAQAHGEDAGDPLNPNPIDIEANVTLDASGHRIFTFALELNRNWTITTGLKKRASGTEAEKILLTDSFTCTTNAENPIKTHAFVLKPSVTEGGKGTIDLKIILDSANTHNIQSITILNDDNPNETFSWVSVDPSHSNEFNIYEENVNSGAYKARIILKNGAGYQKFCSVQTINVFDNMDTNKWEGVPLVTSGTTEDTQKFQVTDNAITQVAKTLYYVGNTTLGSVSVVNGTDKGTGSPAAPFASLQKAIDTIAANGNGTKDYTIFVNGEISSATGTNLPAGPAGLNGKANSIRIQGKNSNTDKLKKTGLETPGSVLNVQTSVPVTIENLTITGGTGTEVSSTLYGGGINIANGASVTLGAGTVVTGNTAQNGSGVCVGGTFIMKGTAKVSENNDVFLKNGKVIAVQSLAGSGLVAKITEEHWTRYSTIVTGTGLNEAIADRFLLTAPGSDGWIKVAAETAITLDSPIYVGSTPTITGLDSNSGTKSSPYATIARACQDITDSSRSYTICVHGTVTGAQTLPDASNTSFAATKIILSGYTGDDDNIEDSINANKEGSALTVNTTVPVEIKNLTITGGKKLSEDGGGINVSQGTVILGDGAKITGNIAGNGGGVYVADGAKLCMYGKALIGDTANPNETAVYDSGDSSKYANCAIASGGSIGIGGGIYSYGEVWLGYKQPADTEEAKEPLVSNATDGYYGVVRNVSTGIAGGIYSFGTLKIASGNVSYNQSGSTYDAGGIYVQTNDVTITGGSIKKNVSHRNGGALYICSGKQVNISGPVEITENSVIAASDSFVAQGGAIYNDGTLEITGSAVITKNSVTNSGSGGSNGGAIAISNTGIVHLNDCTIGGDSLQNEAGSKGGAVYNNGQLFMAGNALIYPGSTKTNDVYLENNKVITVKGTLTNSTGAAHVATITPSQYKRGIRILAGATGTEPYSLTETDPALFALCENDSDWTKNLSSNQVTITAPVYVVDAADSLNTRPAGFGLGNTAANGALGTKSKPFSTITDALTVFEGTGEAEIIIAGTVNGAQSISSMNPAQLTLKGYRPESAAADYVSTAALSGGFMTPTANGSTLSVNLSSKTVIIQDLTIKGGNTTTNGGGINLTGGTVRLADLAKVTGNAATANGGGVYVGTGTTLLMTGTAWVGDGTLSQAALNDDGTGFTNKAGKGAGIYNAGGTVALGYASYESESDYEKVGLSGGVGRNFATTDGAGIYNANGRLILGNGKISYNTSSSKGGGLYTESSSVVLVPSATDTAFNMNKASKGGGFYITETGSVRFAGTAVLTNNTATGEGGAVYNAGTFTMEAGTIGGAGNQNTADSAGGAVYNGGTFNFSGVAYVYPGIVTAEKKYNDVYLTENNYVNIPASYSTSGAQTSMSRMAISPYLYKRGTKILKVADSVTVDDTLKARFKLADDPENDWSKENKQETVSGVTQKYVVINSPVYVAGTAASDTSRVLCGAGRTAAEGALGTKSRPFSTIAEALSVFEDSTSAANITVDGEVNGAQTIGGTGVTINASEIHIYKIHVAGVGGSGKLNGGFNASSTGSVLTIDTSILVNLSGLEITGGYSTANGGGINIINSSAKVTLDNVKIQGNYAAANGGGIYIPAGAKVAGYGDNFIIGNQDATGPAGSGTALSTGINKAANGGGIYNAGIFRLGGSVDSSGNIAGVDGNCGVYANVATESTDDTGNGGGIYVATTGEIQFAHGSVKYNYASTSGGAVYNLGSTVLWGDTVLYDSTNAEKTNDIYLSGNTKLSVQSDQSSVNGTNPVATITPSAWTRGKEVLASESSSTTNLTNSYSKFKVSDSDWSVGYYVSGTATADLASRIGADIWVAGTYDSAALSTGVGNTVTGGKAPDNTNRGTKKQPYADIATAVAASWSSIRDFTINIDGAVGGAQTIGGTISADSITIKGYKAAGATSSTAKINAGGASGAGSALTVNASGKTVTIADLTITGGNATNGGGINITKGTVILTDGSVVTGNQATNGGGVYVAGADARLLMNGKALIGDSASSVTVAESTNTTTYANKATDGAGIYAYDNSSVYLGYSLDSSGNLTTTNSALISNATNGYYGVRRNYATGDGGGIYSKTNTVKIASGNVSYNQAAVGGGIYFRAATTIDAGSIDGNKAQNGGGIYIASNTGITLKSVSMTANSAVGSDSIDACGGAVYNGGGTLTLSDVTPAASITGNYASTSSQNAFGGAIYNPSGGSVNIYGAATINNNQATTSGTDKTGYGGAIYNGGIVEIKKGNIGSTNPNTATSAGGAIYQSGNVCKIGGTNVSITSGSAQTNDIYIAENKPLTITDTLPTGAQIAITPWTFVRGKKLIKTSSTYADELAKFKVTKPADATNNEWKLYKPFADGTDRWARLDADLWVASTGSSSGRASSVSEPPATASERNGTKAKPYATIAEALAQVWDDGTSKTVDFVVNISGSLNGEQSIANTVTNAKSIKLLGDANADKTEIDGNNEARTSSLLTINTAVPVTIASLTIKNGNSSGSGGGISVSAAGASLTLSTGAVVSGNTTSGNGGGIYIAGTDAGNANLIMNSTATVSSNSAGTHNGGGVYLENANLCMSGTALIGDTGVTSIADNGTGASNSAARGGGVYCSTGSNIYLGCNTSGETSSGGVSYELSPGYGICHNYGKLTGGGVDLRAGSMTIKSGAVSYNSTYYSRNGADGGGIWQLSGTTITMSGGTIAKNQACKGGGVYAGGNFIMTGGTIGDSSKNSPADNRADSCSNYAYTDGGGIYAPSGASVSISGGYINFNASDDGGGIYWEGSTLSVTDGNISYNYGGYGGGICFKSGATLSKATFTKNDASSGGALYIDSGKEVTVSGAAAFTGNTASNGGAVYNDGTFNLTGGATFTSNSASTSGGAVYNDGAFTMSAGTIGGSSGQNSAGSDGGAVWCDSDSTFTMSGSAYIPYGGSVKSNDIFLNSSSIGLGNTLSNHSTSSQVGVTLSSGFPTGNAVLTGGTDSDAYAYTKLHYKKFKLTNNTGYFIDSSGKYQLGYVVTASNITDVINNLSSGTSTRIVLEGSFSNFSELKTALSSSGAKIALDMSGATGITLIPDNAFAGCTSLYSIRLPSTIIKIGTKAFYDCTNLGTYYNGFVSTSSDQTVFLPASCTEIGQQAFVNCHFNNMDLAHVNTLYTNAFVGWSGTGNKTITFARESGQTAKLYTGSSYNTLAGTYDLSLATSYYDYLGYSDGKWVRQ